MKDTLNHSKGSGLYCLKNIEKPSKELKQRKDVTRLKFIKITLVPV